MGIPVVIINSAFAISIVQKKKKKQLRSLCRFSIQNLGGYTKLKALYQRYTPLILTLLFTVIKAREHPFFHFFASKNRIDRNNII